MTFDALTDEQLATVFGNKQPIFRIAIRSDVKLDPDVAARLLEAMYNEIDRWERMSQADWLSMTHRHHLAYMASQCKPSTPSAKVKWEWLELPAR